MAKQCAFPGCTTDISNRVSNTKWCTGCRLKMDRSRAARRHGAEARKALDPFIRAAVVDAARGDDNRDPQRLRCLECCDMPWARAPGRYNTRSGEGRAFVLQNGVCNGCGKPWAPEPPLELGSALRSNMGAALAHGQYFGGEPTRNAYAVPTGRRKRSKGA